VDTLQLQASCSVEYASDEAGDCPPNNQQGQKEVTMFQGHCQAASKGWIAYSRLRVEATRELNTHSVQLSTTLQQLTKK
jgi:hypothetical protein